MVAAAGSIEGIRLHDLNADYDRQQISEFIPVLLEQVCG
jgi:hypothetical protein